MNMKAKNLSEIYALSDPAIRGNVNITELNKLTEEAKELLAIFFNAKDSLDMVYVTYTDFLLNKSSACNTNISSW